MKRYAETYLVIFFVLTTCAACQEKKIAPGYSGDPYMGTLKVSIVHPDYPVKNDQGTGSARITDQKDGKSRLVIFGTIKKKDGDAGFAVDGSYDGKGWKSDSSDIAFEIAPDGSITGEGTMPGQKFQFSGDVTESVFKLGVKVEVLEKTEGGYPPGTVFNFNYDLKRDKAIAKSGGAKEKPTNKSGPCGSIHWEFRNIWTPGGLQMIQVPVCD